VEGSQPRPQQGVQGVTGVSGGGVKE
jgi:hypothetical protein